MATPILLTGSRTLYTIRTATLGSEEAREEIQDAAGTYLGAIVYVRRRHSAGGSSYGWRPERSAHNARLTDKLGAVTRLPMVQTDT